MKIRPVQYYGVNFFGGTVCNCIAFDKDFLKLMSFLSISISVDFFKFFLLISLCWIAWWCRASKIIDDRCTQSFSALKKFDCARTRAQPENLRPRSRERSQIFARPCAHARAQFLQDLALTLALKTFWAPLNFALILKFLKVGNVQQNNDFSSFNSFLGQIFTYFQI